MILLYVFSLIVFSLYVFVLLVKFGIPKSISESSYLYGKNGKYIFWAGLTLVVLPMLVYWLEITIGQSYQALVFLSCASLCFTAITGRFRGDEGKMQANIHTYGTIICAILAQLWAWFSISWFWIVSIIAFAIAILLGFENKGAQLDLKTNEITNDKNSVVFFVEMALFIFTFIAIFIYR
jgi:hypothetical protein